MSYTELEFKVASQLEIPRLVFMLDDDAFIPPRLVADLDYGSRQHLFRRHLEESGITIRRIRTVAELAEAITASINYLGEQHKSAAGIADPVADAHGVEYSSIDDDEASLRTRKRTNIVAVLISAIVLAGLFIAWLVQPSVVSVPITSGEQVADGMQTLRAAGLSPEEAQVFSPRDQVGKIVNTDPPQDASVAVGSRIVVFVGYFSDNLDDVSIPNLKGYTIEAATQLLQHSSLILGRQYQRPTTNAQEVGVIVSQDPPAGTVVSGSQTAVNVEIGRRP